MAHIESGGRGGRSISLEPNLVPFIDLMSVLITFLLISAVWTQVQMIQMGSSMYSQSLEDTDPPPPTPQAEVVLKVEVKSSGFGLVIGNQNFLLPKLGDGSFDEAGLRAQLQRVKELYPQKIDATLAVADDIPYEFMIRTMDQILLTGFSNINFATGEPP